MSIPEMLRSSWLIDLSLDERGGSFDSGLVLEDDRLCSSLKLRLLNSPTRFFGLTLTAGNVYKIEQECIPVGCVPHTSQPYVFRWLPLDISRVFLGGEG